MNVRHSRLARLVALTVVASMPLLGMAGVASAKAHAKGCHKTHSCKAGGGSGSGSGSGGPTVQITVNASPNPLVETGQSEVHAVIEVETLPSFAGDEVTVSSTQLVASCGGGVLYTTIQRGYNQFFSNQISVVLDDDGNATVKVAAVDCAPGTDLISADLDVAPFLTALTTLLVEPPAVTPVGLTGYPEVGGVAQEVETGDTSTSGDSDIYAVFYVEDNPVYAEQTVEISSSQLEGRCIGGWWWTGGDFPTPLTIHGVGPNTTQPPISTILDDDGNAVFAFKGISCAAGTSQVIADVKAGTHDTFVTTFTVLPPAPTI